MTDKPTIFQALRDAAPDAFRGVCSLCYMEDMRGDGDGSAMSGDVGCYGHAPAGWANVCAAIIVAAYEAQWASDVGHLYRKGEPCYDLLVNDWHDEMPRMVERVLRQWPEAIVWCEDAMDLDRLKRLYREGKVCSADVRAVSEWVRDAYWVWCDDDPTMRGW